MYETQIHRGKANETAPGELHLPAGPAVAAGGGRRLLTARPVASRALRRSSARHSSACVLCFIQHRDYCKGGWGKGAQGK
jgi:hypothetical protein